MLREQQRLRREDAERLEAEDLEAQCRKEQVQVAEATAERLQSIKAYAETVVALEHPPTELRAKITKDLESYVTAEQFPSSLSIVTAYEYARGRVEKILASWKSERAASEAREKLLSYGRHQARILTRHWNSTEAKEAISTLETILVKETVIDLTQKDMREYVESFLDAF